MNELQRRMVDGVTGYHEIGCALGKVCRFGGRLRQFYPVLAHSMVVGRLVARGAPEWEVYGLLHDAAEMFCGDVPRPFKTHTAVIVEDEVLRRLYARLGLPWPSAEAQAAVKTADAAAGQSEWHLLRPYDFDRVPEDRYPDRDPTGDHLTEEMAAHEPAAWLRSDAQPLVFADWCAFAEGMLKAQGEGQ